METRVLQLKSDSRRENEFYTSFPGSFATDWMSSLILYIYYSSRTDTANDILLTVGFKSVARGAEGKLRQGNFVAIKWTIEWGRGGGATWGFLGNKSHMVVNELPWAFKHVSPLPFTTIQTWHNLQPTPPFVIRFHLKLNIQEVARNILRKIFFIIFSSRIFRAIKKNFKSVGMGRWGANENPAARCYEYCKLKIKFCVLEERIDEVESRLHDLCC